MKNHTIILVVSVLLCSCNFSTTSVKNPEFTLPTTTISQKIKILASYEEIYYQSEKKDVNGVKSATMIVKIINATNIPTRTDAINTVAIQIARLLKQDLKDLNEYDSYRVIFESHEQTSNGSYDFTSTHNFKKGEL